MLKVTDLDNTAKNKVVFVWTPRTGRVITSKDWNFPCEVYIQKEWVRVNDEYELINHHKENNMAELLIKTGHVSYMANHPKQES